MMPFESWSGTDRKLYSRKVSYSALAIIGLLS